MSFLFFILPAFFLHCPYLFLHMGKSVLLCAFEPISNGLIRGTVKLKEGLEKELLPRRG